jgi:fibronectin type 3 domain-containing protein/TolB-like protein
MLRYLLFICFVVIGWSEAAYPLDTMRPKLACFPLAAKSIDALAYNENISSLLVNALDRAGVVELIERKKIETVIEQHGLRLDTLDQAKLRDLGAQAGFDFILTGVVGRKEGKLFIDLSLIGTHSLKINHTWTHKIGDGEISSKLEEITASIIPIMRAAQNEDSLVTPVKPSPVLSAPSELQASGTSRSIRLKWNQPAAENISGYKIFRSTSSGGAYCQLANSSVNSYSDENLELNDSFYYKVRALGREGGESDFSQAVQGKTIVVPQPPVFMLAEPQVRSAALSWYQRPVSGGDPMLVPVSYRVYRSPADKNDYQQVTQINSGSAAYTDSPLLEGSNYRYYLTSVNASGGESEHSATLEVTTVGGVGEVTAGSGQIRKIPLSWKPHPFASIGGYHVYRSAVKEGPFEKIGRTNSREATDYLDVVDSDSTVRWYRIAGINKDGTETLPGTAVSATTRPIPPAPEAPRVKSGEARRITVSWLASGSPDEKGGYGIYRSEQEQGSFAQIARVAENVTVYQDSASPLKDNASYWYRIATLNAAGIEGSLSAAVKGVTKARPEAPKGVTAKSGEVRKVSLNWQQNGENDIREYRLWRRQSGKTFAMLSSTKMLSHVEGGLPDGTLCAYAVTAVDSDGLESDLSVPVEATTAYAPSRASGARLEFRDGVAGIAWGKNPESNVRTYCVYRKGFLGPQKLGETSETEYFYRGTDKVELFVTAVNIEGLESEPSATVTIEKR